MGMIRERFRAKKHGRFDDIGSPILGTPGVALSAQIAEVSGVSYLVLLGYDEWAS